MAHSAQWSALADDGVLTTLRTGWDLLADPLLNKGTAFTEAERDVFGLHGLLPPQYRYPGGAGVAPAERCCTVLPATSSATPFCANCTTTTKPCSFALLEQNIEDLLPLVYTPTVGAGCQQFSQSVQKAARSLFEPAAQAGGWHQILANPRFDRVEVDCHYRRRADFGAGRPGCGRHGHPDREIGAIHRVRRAAPGDDPADHARCRHRQPGAARPTRSIGWRHERVRGDGIRRFRRGGGGRGHPALAACAAAMGRFRQRPMPRGCSTAIATGCAPSTTTSREPRRLPPAPCCRRSTYRRAVDEQRIACWARARPGAASPAAYWKMMVEAGLPERSRPRAFLHGRPRRPPGRRHERGCSRFSEPFRATEGAAVETGHSTIPDEDRVARCRGQRPSRPC